MKTINYTGKFRRFFLALTLISIFVFSGNQTYATHCAGADIQFCWVGPGPNTYQFTYTFYRNCGSPANWFPAQEPFSVPLRIVSTTCGVNTTITLTQAPPPNGDQVSLACGTVVTSCDSVGGVQGYRKWIYIGTFTLPALCSDWNFSVDVNARNENITTLNNPGSQSLTVRATLNNILAPSDCSPGFSNPPLAFLCVNQPMSYNHSAIDAEGDSLVYSLVDPLRTVLPNIVPVAYLPPFSTANPLSNSNLTLNPQTGELNVTPTANGELAVLAFRVEEYRNGQLIGSVMRDMQVLVMVCTNNLPVASGFNSTTNYAVTICTDIQSCFTITTSDPNVGDSVTMTWNSGIPTASLIISGAPLPTGTFCWTPTIADVGLNVFTVLVQDNACPIRGSQAFTYSVTVASPPVIGFVGNPEICEGDSTTIVATGANTYVWTPNLFINTDVGPAVTMFPPDDQTYTVVGTSPDGCTGTSSITINVTPDPIIFTPANPTVCAGGSQTVNVGGALFYSWSPTTGIINSNPDSSVVEIASGSTTIYTVVGSSLEGCTGVGTFTFTVNPNPVPVVGSNSPICAGAQLNLTATGGASYSWTGPNSFSSNSQNPSIPNATIAASGNYSVIVTDANSCVGTGSVSVIVNSNPVPVVGSNAPICAGSQLNLTASGGATYSWTGPNSFSSNSQNPSIPSSTTAATGVYSVIVTDANSCVSTGTVSVTVNANPVPVVGSNSPICDGSQLDLTASGGASYSWTGPNSFSSNSQNPSILGATTAATGVYTVIVTDVNSCVSTGTVSVTINANPIPVVGSNSPICDGSQLDLTASGGASYSWTGPNSFSSNSQNPSIPSSTTAATGVYTVIVTDANSCVSTGTVNITVNADPVPVVGSNSPICEASQLDLNASGGTSYAWTGPNSFSSGSQNPSIPAAAVAASGIYTVIVTDANSCESTGTVSVTVNANPVPVITPDGPLSFCIGGSVNLDAGVWDSYLWSGAGELTQMINVSTNRTVDVTVSDGNGCQGTSAPVTVTVNPLPPAVVTPAGPVLVCSGSPAALSANVGVGFTYQWFFNSVEIPGAVGDQHLAPAAGMYSVRVTDANGCSSLSNSVEVIQGVGPNVSIVSPPPLACLANTIYVGYGPQSITLTAEPPAASYLWSPNGEETQSISVTVPGEYSVIAFDANGCPSPTPAVLSPAINVIDIRCGHNLQKVTLCHVPEGNFDNPQTICIGEPAIEPHLRLHRWDCLGPCSLYYPTRVTDVVEDFYAMPYPNPFNTAFNLHIFTASNEVIYVNVIDVTGRVVESYSEVDEQTQIGENLGAGVYTAIVSQGENRRMVQIIKTAR